MGGENGIVSVEESVSGLLTQISLLGDDAHAEAVHRVRINKRN